MCSKISELINNLKPKINEIDKNLENSKNQIKDIWSPEQGKLLQNISHMEEILEGYNKYLEEYNLYAELQLESLKDEEKQELDILYKKLEENLHNFTLNLMFSEEDREDCYLELQSGTGGADAEDLTSILYRMYHQWAIETNRKCTTIDVWPTDNGIKTIILHIKGSNSYGFLRRETGIHRIVRYSPFNSLNKRQTSFISVYVYPLIKENVVTIEEKDLIFEYSRSSGAGGQHVNKTESAVKVIHIPTGVTVRCENERSQMMNKQMAIKLLKAKLTMREKVLKQEKEQSMEKADISWGQQIRSYTLNPYQLVKDLRTGYETANIKEFLDGKILNKCLYYNITKIK